MTGMLKTDLCIRLGIDHPVVLAPMAGSTNATLVAAVGNAGGLGSHGCAAVPPDRLGAETAAIRAATNRPFNLNFFVHRTPVADPGREKALQARLQPFFDELDLGPVPSAAAPFPPFGTTHLEALLADPPPIVSFHFGLPGADTLAPLKAKGCLNVSSATTVAQARWLEEHGADVIVAQGAEAGGHRGTFLNDDYASAMIGTLALVPQIVDAVDMPVVAAGGIADGRGLAAALALGAQAVQMGTAFLQTDESPIDSSYRTALSDAEGERTQVTKVFSGRPARGIRNRYLEQMADVEHDLPDFPLPYGMNGALRKAATERGIADFPSFWAGQAVALARPEAAAALVERIVDEAQAVIAGLSG